MCTCTTLTVLCAVCQVAITDHRFEETPCEAVRKGRTWACDAQPGSTSGAVMFRQEVGKAVCAECEEVRRRQQLLEGARVKEGEGEDEEGDEAARLRRYAERGPMGDRPLRLDSAWRWDARSPSPSAVASPTAAAAASTTPTTTTTPSSSQQLSVPSRAPTRQNSQSSSMSSSSTGAESDEPGNLSGDRDLRIHSAKYWNE